MLNTLKCTKIEIRFRLNKTILHGKILVSWNIHILLRQLWHCTIIDWSIGWQDLGINITVINAIVNPVFTSCCSKMVNMISPMRMYQVMTWTIELTCSWWLGAKKNSWKRFIVYFNINDFLLNLISTSPLVKDGSRGSTELAAANPCREQGLKFATSSCRHKREWRAGDAEAIEGC